MTKPKSVSENIKVLSDTYNYLTFRLSALRELVKDGGKTLFANFQEEHKRNFQILRYERIVDPDKLLFPIPTTSYVTPKTFAKHCKCLRKFCNVISLPQLLDSLKDGKHLPERSVVITLDGGHLDTFINSPIPLKENGLSATYFVSTSYISSNTLYPEDRIAYICERLKLAEEKIYKSESTAFLFNSFQENQNLEHLDFDADATRSILKFFRSLPPEKGEYFIRALGEYAKRVGYLAAPEPDFMEWKDLDYLQNLGFHIGSLGHSFLPNVYLEEREIVDDYRKANSLLSDSGIQDIGIPAVPYNILSNAALDAFSNMNMEFILSGLNPKIQFDQSPVILSRKFIVEATSFSEDLFIKDVWS